ncbi:MAG: anthranilate synthase component I family protein [Thermodesulfovibrio sp.]|uniref:chorismate-binding protein n=1 Tax=unclassified Thermodesulfovibrio TaxID=2645936 RepID=UPI00083B01CD|nr:MULTISPECIES: anthranilate synthase component I family protein [unclassified Thermodesulfovibrio]MDI1471879.1 anthranilate synthase component I family protein [Thermodesulfovibrio sp. 1176]MDI6714950.1 anthranilate synthase component I family protein [Thermodesulfovibrio sp.]ODA44795.1 Para-aminobenzoate synthase, aminase component [Thermodesulfovibrio sp. N1]
MRLILSGEWFKKKGFYEAHIESVSFYNSLLDIGEIPALSFVVFSFDLSGETLNLNLKETEFPKIIVIKIKKIKKLFEVNKTPIFLKLKSQTLKNSDFKLGVLKIKNLIKEGTVYQINLTNRFDFYLSGDPLALFLNFYTNQPVPYGFYLDLDQFYIISGSMELFLEKKGFILKSKPIKGTSKNLNFLKLSEKDRAENLMITDMMRNDIGKIAQIGSVKVTELFKIKKYRTLYQMYSTVEGFSEKSIIDIIKATFPPASVTGAPKRKAVEMIDNLEPHARGYYCGCAGIVENETDFTLSVLIRTAVGKENHLSYYAGCGIVWDSNPEQELSELYLKVKAFYSPCHSQVKNK